MDEPISNKFADPNILRTFASLFIYIYWVKERRIMFDVGISGERDG